MTPKRIQLSRQLGWRKPEGAIVVSRPSRWGNPFRAGSSYPWADGEPCPYPQPGTRIGSGGETLVRCDTVEQAVEWFSTWITRMVPALADDARRFLAGHDLACWCRPDAVCHGDVLLAIAGGEPS